MPPRESGATPPTGERTVLLFAGQGSQHNAMAFGLYGRVAAFTDAIDAFLDSMGPRADRLRRVWADPTDEDIHRTEYSQPLLFAIGYALGRTVLSWGRRPDMLLGHSVGELAAAAVAGVFTVPDVARLIIDRNAALATAPAGGMLAVSASVDELARFVGPDVVIAAINGPRQCLVSGPEPTLTEVERRIRAADVTCRRVRADRGFHSPSVEPQALLTMPSFAAVRTSPPRFPVYSAYTGAPLGDRQRTDPKFWAIQPARPVLFGPTLSAILAQSSLTARTVVVDASPGQALASLARRHPAVGMGACRVIGLLPTRRTHPDADVDTLTAAREFLARRSDDRAARGQCGGGNG